ncbi:hypothetical protein AAFH49_04535 [Hymenobacter segetis]|uniref:Uncharacterized protein n=1 Tax=Hymenobacter segetis TaxID=2025509 RepID=A0ABU9LS08_9BACT
MPATPADGGGVAGTRHPAMKALSPAEYYKWAGDYLRNNRNAPRAYRLELINWRHQYQLQQEAAELKANPAAAADLRLIAERLARKAQSGFSGPPDTSPPSSSR